MESARFVGRVGGLAVALGVGLAIGGTAGIAWAEPEASAESTTVSDTRASDHKTAGPSASQSHSGDHADARDADSDTDDRDDEAASASAEEGTAEPEAADAEDERKHRTAKGAGRETDSETETPTLDRVKMHDSVPAPVSPAPDPMVPAALTLMTATSSARRESVTAALPRTEYSVTSVGVGRGPSAVALSPDGARAYVTNSTDRTVSVVDTATGTLVKSVAVGGSASAVALSPDGSRAYIALKSASKLAVMDTATHSVITTVSVGWSPSAVAVNANGTRVYVSNPGSGTMSVIDAATNRKVTSVTIGSSPAGLAVNPTGTRVYVAVRGSDRIAVVDAATNKLITKIAVADSPVDAAAPSGSAVYAIHSGGGMSVIDPATNSVTASGLYVGASPTAIAANADGSKLFVANANEWLSVFDTATKSSEAVPIDFAPETGMHDIAVSADGNRIYITDAADRVLRVVTATVIPNSVPELVSGPTTGSAALYDGALSGRFTVRDADRDALTRRVSREPGSGEVIVSEVVGEDGTVYTFTYTPTEAARELARQTPGDDSDTFTVTVSDGIAQVDVVVSVPILPSSPTIPTTGATRISVGPRPVTSFIVGSRLYVANGDDGSVSVIDTATNRMVNTVPGVDVRYRRIPITASADGRYLYASRYRNYDATASIAVIDTATGAVVATVVMPTCESECWSYSAGITDMEISSDGARLYAAEKWGYAGTVTTVDLTTNTVVANHAVGEYMDYYAELELTADGSRMYAGPGYPYSPHLEVIDPTNGVLLKYIPLTGVSNNWARSVGSMVLSPNGKRLVARIAEFDPSSSSDTIVIIDTDPASATFDKHIGTVTVSAGATDVQVSADSTRAYVTHDGGKLITVLNLASNAIAGVIPSSALGGDYSSLAVGANGTLYVTNAADNSVYAVTL